MRKLTTVEALLLVVLVALLGLQLWIAAQGIRGFAITPGAKIQEEIEELERE